MRQLEANGSEVCCGQQLQYCVCVRLYATGLFVHTMKIHNWSEALLALTCTCGYSCVEQRQRTVTYSHVSHLWAGIWD